MKPISLLGLIAASLSAPTAAKTMAKALPFSWRPTTLAVPQNRLVPTGPLICSDA